MVCVKSGRKPIQRWATCDNREGASRLMSADPPDAKVSAAQGLYRALRTGDRDALRALLHADFIGHATEGLPLAMGGEHVGPDNMQRNLWWRIGRHYNVEAQVDEFRFVDY